MTNSVARQGVDLSTGDTSSCAPAVRQTQRGKAW
jgi:hypothetical protein